MLIKEVANKVFEIFQNSDLRYKDTSNIYVVFDKNNNYYIALTEVHPSTANLNVQSFCLKLYSVNNNPTQPTSVNWCGQVLYQKNFDVSQNNKRKLTLTLENEIERISIDENIARLGLGSELLRVIELETYNENILLHTGTVCGFNYMKGKDDLVKNFYKKNNFKIETTKQKILKENSFNEYEEYNRHDFEKVLSKNEIDDIKKRTITFPINDKNIIMILPKQQILESDYSK